MDNGNGRFHMPEPEKRPTIPAEIPGIPEEEIEYKRVGGRRKKYPTIFERLEGLRNRLRQVALDSWCYWAILSGYPDGRDELDHSSADGLQRLIDEIEIEVEDIESTTRGVVAILGDPDYIVRRKGK